MAAKGQSSERSMSMRKLHFFKVLMGDFKHRLKIPQNFMKRISMETSRRAILHGPNGNTWHVKLDKTVNGMFLSSGWEKFVRDHALKEYEFLVFRHDGNMHFCVLIFDKTACERDELFVNQNKRKSLLCGGEKRKFATMKNLLEVRSTIQYPSTKHELPSIGKHVSDKLQVKSLHSAGRRTSSPKVGGTANIKKEGDMLPVKTKEERLEAHEAAKSFSSTFPCIVLPMSMSRAYGYTMWFPADFARKHLPRERTKMIVRDPDGKAWAMVYVPEKIKRLSGWYRFARGNNLKVGDFCAFELTGPVEMNVHIFRVTKETTPLLQTSRKRS